MRKYVVLAAAAAVATGAALFVGASSASADGTTVINAGPAQYSIGFQHPTGTVSVGGGTISARCTAASLRGSATFLTPQCVTRVISCPVTATSCSLVWNVHESALRGPVAFGAQLVFSGGIGGAVALQPYNCPQAFSCRVKFLVTGISPGETVQSSVFNILYAPGYPTVFDQVTLSVA